MIRRPPRSTHCISSAASDVYKRQATVCSSQHKSTFIYTRDRKRPSFLVRIRFICRHQQTLKPLEYSHIVNNQFLVFIRIVQKLISPFIDSHLLRDGFSQTLYVKTYRELNDIQQMTHITIDRDRPSFFLQADPTVPNASSAKKSSFHHFLA
eukprot:TRINITY_DN11707_c0_g2_i1.p1 TRINITY_DN11707_c0_g2~~TRINITY_DN11707_c0_g2_i1.p1  ORF type:complete len:152 (+),score=0.52 TRINITY_DN11707_c0_g2_i1:110-565(+)